MSGVDFNQYGKREDSFTSEDGYSIQELMDILFSHVKMIVAITILAGILSFSVSQFLITPYYEASVKLFVNNSKVGQTDITNINDLNASARLVNTYMEIVKSNTLLQKVAAKSGDEYTTEQLKKMVTTESVQNTEIFYVTVTSKDPQDARRLANQIAADAPAEIMDFVEATSVKVIDYATIPTKPSTPNVQINTAIGLLLGLILSVFLALLRDMLDVTIRSEDDLKFLVDLPILGVIPTIEIVDPKAKFKKRKGNRHTYEY